MKAILIATGKLPAAHLLGEQYAPELLPLMDRPFIQHVVEYLVGKGVEEFEVVLCRFPEKVEQLLGDGTRWGSAIDYHLVKDPAKPYRPVKFVTIDPKDDPVLLIHCDRLPQADILQARPSSGSDGPVLYMWDNHLNRESNGRPDWSGWGWLSEKCRAELPEDLDEQGLLDYLLSFSDGSQIMIDAARALTVRSYSELLASHRAVLANKFDGLLLTGTEVEPGIWISRNVQLHPTAQLKPPVFVGENCDIGKVACLGPNAVLGSDCVIDTKSVVADAVIFPKSYVGEALEIQEAIVDRNRLINVRFGSEVTITEDFILGSLSEKRLQNWLKKVLSQLLAAGLLILLLPLFVFIVIYLKLFRKNEPLLYKAEKVRLPAPSDSILWRTFALISFCHQTTSSQEGQLPETSKLTAGIATARWRDFLLRFIPALFNVARGELRFVGVTPRTTNEINRLPDDWRSIYLKSKPGIVTEAVVNFGENPTQDELYAAETFYAVSAGLMYDLRLLGKYLGQLIGLVPLPVAKG
jgi:lipopolysaccharide/colanic/teichoic acid biosynthesis glycosyltransferase